MKNKILYLILMFSLCATVNAQHNSSVQNVENPPPEIHFSWTGTCAGDTTCFFNASLLADTYTWTIADSANPHAVFTSNDTNLCYFFHGSGTYYVTLTAYNNHTVSMTDTLHITGVTKAAFEWVHCTNQFVNNSMCAYSFQWNFGDDSTSTLAMPIHQYADTGHYNVTLIASNGLYSDTLTKNVYINPRGYSNPHFTTTVSLDTVRVHAVYYDGLTDYYWTFNDVNNNFATGRDTLHVYNDAVPTMHLINLLTRNGCGFFSEMDTVYTDTAHVVPPDSTHTDTTHVIVPDSSSLPSHLTFVSNLSITPSPSVNGLINVYYNSYNDAEYTAGIYDALGQKVYAARFYFQAGINGFSISSDGIAEGNYILILQSENTYARRKFQVRH